MIFSNGLVCGILEVMRVFVCFVVLLCASFGFVQSVAAQQEGGLLSEPSDLDDLLSGQGNEYEDLRDPEPYKNTPQEYLEEAVAFHEECQSDYRLFQYYNCECLSSKYLDTRIESGPERVKNSIVLSLQRECKDGAYAAGIQYNKCMRNGTTLFAKGKSPEEYCECFGNKYAQLYEAGSAVPGSYGMVHVGAQAHIQCQ